MPIAILLIEPSEPDRYWIRLVLREVAIPHILYECGSSLSAIEELALAPITRFDLVVINVVLPVLDLKDAVEQLRALPQLTSAKFAVTVLDEHDSARVPAGCALLTKPVTVEALRRICC